MGIFFTVLLVLAVVSGAILAIILFIPINYFFQGGYKESFFFDGYLQGSPFYRLAYAARGTEQVLRITLLGLTFPVAIDKKETEKDKAKKEKKKEKQKKKKKKKYSYSWRAIVHALFQGGLLESAFRLLKDLLHALAPDYVEVKGKAGFDEPHLTGYMVALLWALRPRPKWLRISLKPVWTEEYYELKVAMDGKGTVVAILYRLLKFFLAKSTREAWKNIKKTRKTLPDAT